MASEAKDKDKEKKPKKDGAEAKAGKAEAKAGKAEAKAEKAEKAAKPAEPPRPPADPRLKVIKKFEKRFLPRGPLRDRQNELLKRWKAGDDHGGVTVEELKSLLNDWRADQARRKPRPTPA